MQLVFPQLKLLDRAFNVLVDKDRFQAQLVQGINLKIQKQEEENCLKDSILCCGCLPSESTRLKQQRQYNLKHALTGTLCGREESETLFELKVSGSQAQIGSWYDVFVFEQWQDTFAVGCHETSFQPTSMMLSPPRHWHSKIILWFSNQKFRLIFTNEEEHHRLFRLIITLKTYYTKLHPESQYSSLAMRLWVQFNADQDHLLTQAEIQVIVQELNFDKSEFYPYLEQLPGWKLGKRLNQDDFMKLIDVLQCPDDLYGLFRKFAKSAKDTGNVYERYSHQCMTGSEFSSFLTQFQHESSHSKASRSSLFAPSVCCSRSSIKTPRTPVIESLSYIQFCRYLLSNSQNPLIIPSDLSTNKPLPHYFVNSSHNTYLIGNQLTSMSSANVYYLNLLEGMRCVELDIHDSSEGPIIKHGFTLTARILFDQAMNAIMKFCIENPNHTPIILSFENHCTEKNIIKMTNTLFKIPFDKFYVIPQKSTNQQQFPTLEQLRGKLIIQGTGDFESMFPGIKKFNKKQQTKKKLKPSDIVEQQKLSPYGSYQKQQFLERVKKMEKEKADAERVLIQVQKRFTQKISTTTRQLNKFYGMVAAPFDSHNSCWEMANIAENNLLKMVKGQMPPTVEQIYQYSWTSMIRIYPFGLRFGSSNYNPIPMLQCGCQMVSLNTQKVDVYYVCMQGIFERNNQEGYVLKPDVKQQSTQRLVVKVVFVGCIDIKPRLAVHNNELTALQISFAGTQHDMKKNFRYVNSSKSLSSIDSNEPITISQSFKAQNVHVQLISLPSYKFNDTKSALNEITQKVYPCVELDVQNIDFANLYVNIPHCGSMSMPLAHVRPGLRILPIYNFDIGRKKTKGHLLVYIEIDKLE